MEQELFRNVKLGFFITLGLVLFITGIFWIGSKQDLFTQKFKISVLFSNANGLKPGNNVRYDGVHAGVVKSVTLRNDSTVQVDIYIEKEKQEFIKSDAIVTIASDGLMGDKVLNIVNGEFSTETIKDGDFIQGTNPINFDKVTKTLLQTNENVEVITENLKILSNNLNGKRGTLQTLMSDTSLANNLTQTFNNIKNLSGKLSESSNSIQKILEDVRTGKNSLGEVLKDSMMAKNLEKSISQIKSVSDKMSNITDQVSITANKINSGKGTVNTLLSDTSMAISLRQSVNNIKNASESFDQNMEALKHSFFLRGYFRKQAKQKVKSGK